MISIKFRTAKKGSDNSTLAFSLFSKTTLQKLIEDREITNTTVCKWNYMRRKEHENEFNKC